MNQERKGNNNSDGDGDEDGQCTLSYFAGRGRANPVRFALALAGVAWKENKITTRKDMLDLIESGKLKPFDQVPMLELDGKAFIQSGAIVRLIARKYNLDGGVSAAEDLHHLEALIDGATDFYCSFLRYPFTDDKEEFLESMVRGKVLKKYLPVFSDLLGSKQFLGGETPVVADAVLLSAFEWATDLCSEDVEKYPTLVAWSKRLWALPQMEKFKRSEYHYELPGDQYRHEVNVSLGRA